MSGEFDYTPPQAIVNPDGSVEIWDAQQKDYTTHYPGSKPTPSREWATGGDNNLFDPATMSERPGNPIATAFDYDSPDDNSGPKFGSLWDHVGGPSQGILNDDVEADANFIDRHEPGVMRDVADVSCPRCGKPSVEGVCSHCGYEKGNNAWTTQDKTPNPAPFNDNVPKRDMNKFDDMVPWGSGAISHYVQPSTASEKSEMTDTYDPIQRMSIGRDDGAELNSCPECSAPMLKRASEGFEFCPDCGHRNKVMDTVVAKDAAYDDYKKDFDGEGDDGTIDCKDCGEPVEPGSHCKSCGTYLPDGARNEPPKKEAGFLNELEHGVSDAGELGKDFYNGHPEEVAGDALNIGADAVKGVGYGVKDHPLMAAALAAPFLLPAAGVGLGAMGAGELAFGGADAAGIGADAMAEGGASAAGRAALQRGLSSGMNTYKALGTRIGLGGNSGEVAAEQAAADSNAAGGLGGKLQGYGAKMPQAMRQGAAFAAGNKAVDAGSSALTGGGAPASGWSPAGGGLAYNPATTVAHIEFTPEEVAERRAWSQDYDLFTHLAADDDQSSDLSVQTDGDNITDPKTQGSQEETGDSLDELLKSLGDTGSANVDSYTPEQNAAIHHWNDNMPTLLAFMLHPDSAKGHPLFEALKQIAEKAFGEPLLDEATDDEHGSDDVPPEHEKSEAPKHESEDEDKKAAHVSVDLTMQNGGVANPSYNKPPNPAQATPGMQPGQQQSVAPCAMCGGPHPTDQHPSAMTPPAQGGQFGTMSKASLLETVAARKPKMCPFHGDLVDYSLTLGDPASARSAVRPSDYGMNYCKSNEFEGKCNFKPAMVTQSYWDERDEKSQQRRDQQIQAVPQDAHVDAVSDDNVPDLGVEEPDTGYVPEPRIDVPAEQLTGVGHGTVNNPDAALQMAAKLLREANVIPSGYHLDLSIVKTAAIADLGVQEGGRYNMKSNKYDVPDDVTVTAVKPTSIQVVYHFPGGMDSAPQEITEEQLRDQGIHTFEPIGSHVQEQPAPLSEQLDARGQGQPDSAPDAGQVTDLSQSHDGAHDPVEAEFDGELEGEAGGEGMQMAAGYREVDGGFFVDADDNPVDYETYSASRRQTTPAEMQWLWDDVQKQNRLTAREQEMQAVMAGRQFSYREQADFIQEPGKARNSDKLDLSGTHYVEGGGYGTDEVPDDHFLLGG